MASGALFGNAASRSQSKNLVEFRAGKMFMRGKTVHPDKRKGLLYIHQSEDSLMHFCWKERTKGNPEDDLIIFPDDCEFQHVTQCTTGRVYLLKFKSTGRKFFFWMQEPKTEKDDEYCRKVNEYLNNPPTPGANRGGGGSGGMGGLPPELAAGLGDSDLQSLLGNMSQQQLMQLLGGMGMGGMGGLSALMGGGAGGGRSGSAQSESNPPSRVQSSPGPRPTSESPAATTPQAPRPVTAAALPSQDEAAPLGTAAVTPRPGANIQLSDLQNILSGLGAGEEGQAREAIDLSAALNPEVMIPILANSDVQSRLLPFLPEGESLPQTEEELRNTVQSPQFQQAMSSFSAALASGQLGPLITQFGLGEEATNAAAQGDVEAFVRAMQGPDTDKEEKKDDEKKE